MFLKKKNKLLQELILSNKTFWLSENGYYKVHLYEDIFIRNYITSFFFKWSKINKAKILGSIYLLRTSGKLYINVFFFSVAHKINKSTFLFKHKKLFKLMSSKIKPLKKCKKHLVILFMFYNLERLLRVQIFFKFTNVCHSIKGSILNKKFSTRFINFLTYKFNVFRYQFKGSIYFNTLSLLVHTFKYKRADSTLLANYIASMLPQIHKHTRFLTFLKKVLQFLSKIFKFAGIKILLSGKLNNFSRAQSKSIQVGQVSLQSVDSFFRYGAATAFSKAGTVGIKIWIC